MKICKICQKNDKECKIMFYKKEYYLCRKHYLQMYHYGKILKRTQRDKNEIIDCKNYCEICLYNENKRGEEPKEIARTKIDKDDLEKVKQYKWCLNKIGYIQNNNIGLLHQLILGKKQRFNIDHINHDTADNRKQNLRHCTQSQNCMNTKAKGITWQKRIKKWQAQITVNYKNIHLGFFIKEQDAIKARRIAEKKYFKEFAYKY